MYAKQQNSQQGRRTPLSLSGAAPASVKEQRQQQLLQQQQSHQQVSSSPKAAGGANSNGVGGKQNEARAATQQKAEQQQPIYAEVKKQHVDKKQQQQQQQSQPTEQTKVTRSTEQQEKRSGGGAQSGSSAKNNGNAKQHQKNGREDVVVIDVDSEQPGKREKSERNARAEKNVEKVDKLATNEDKKEKERDSVKKVTEVEPKVSETTKLDKKKQPSENNDTEIIEISEDVVAKPIELKPATPNKATEKDTTTTPTKPITPKASSPILPAIPVTEVILEEDQPIRKLEISPRKRLAIADIVSATFSGPTVQLPAATSTPGKALGVSCKPSKTTEILLSMECGSSPDRNNSARTFSQIAGRRSIRPIGDFSGPQYRESYRRINTELDVSSTTNTSMNVTVGSEVPNNSSFSFFGRGRKRERTPPISQSAIELQTDGELSPPKRARLDMYSFFTAAVSSPLTLLRSRFSRASIHSEIRAAPLHYKDDEMGEVQNVSGISIEEELPSSNGDADEVTATGDVTATEESSQDVASEDVAPKKDANALSENDGADADIKEKLQLNKSDESVAIDADGQDAAIVNADGDPLAKTKRCIIM